MIEFNFSFNSPSLEILTLLVSVMSLIMTVFIGIVANDFLKAKKRDEQIIKLEDISHNTKNKWYPINVQSIRRVFESKKALILNYQNRITVGVVEKIIGEGEAFIYKSYFDTNKKGILKKISIENQISIEIRTIDIDWISEMIKGIEDVQDGNNIWLK